MTPATPAEGELRCALAKLAAENVRLELAGKRLIEALDGARVPPAELAAARAAFPGETAS